MIFTLFATIYLVSGLTYNGQLAFGKASPEEWLEHVADLWEESFPEITPENPEWTNVGRVRRSVWPENQNNYEK